MIGKDATGKRANWVGLMVLAVGCADASAGGPDGTAGSSTSGPGMDGLPCEGLTIDCRLAFSDDYTGSFMGARTGTLTLYVNVIGGVEGTAGADMVTGQVNEFGHIEFSLADGTEFVGQFAADHSFRGTWMGPGGTGTFSGRVAGTPPGSGGGGASGTGGTSAAPGSDAAARSRAACEAVRGCPGAADQIDCSMATAPSAACMVQANAAFDCIVADPCNAETACEAQVSAFVECDFGLGGGSLTEPETVYEPSGNETYDEAIAVCSACEAEATACHDLPECLLYSVCAEACPTDNIIACTDGCWDQYPAGHDAWFDAQWCDLNQCL